MVSIQQAEQSVLRAKEQTTQAETGISKYEQSLPKTGTQQSLRQKIGKGLMGMITRKKVTRAKEQAQLARGQIQQFRGDVSDYEQKLQELKTQIAPRARTTELINIMLKGKPLPMGTTTEEARAVERAIELNPDIQRAIERISTEGILQSGEVTQFTPTQVQQLELMGYKFSPVTQEVTTFQPPRDGGVQSQIDFKDYLDTSKEAKNFKEFITSLPTGIGFVSASARNVTNIDERGTWDKIKDAILLKPTKETYVPELGAFVSASQTGPDATAFIRPPTIGETKAIQLAEYKGSWDRLIGKPQEKFKPIYFGGTEISKLNVPKITPVYKDPFTGNSIGGTPIVEDFYSGPIKTDYSRSPIRKVEEFLFPAASIPLTMRDEQVYLPDRTSEDKFKKLIRPNKPFLGTGGKDMIKFLRDQQTQYKKDLGKYEVLVTLRNSGVVLDKLKQRELLNLERKIKIGQRRTTVQDIIYESTRDSKLGKNLYTGLVGGQYGYEAGKIALGFELGIKRSEERRVGKECRSRWSPYH